MAVAQLVERARRLYFIDQIQKPDRIAAGLVSQNKDLPY
jgi:hypothetical protein